MASHLVPCPACQRHVRVSEVSCPFCTETLSQSLRNRSAEPLPAARLGRAALYAFRASLTGVAVIAAGSVAVAGTVACSSDSDNGGGSGQQTSGGTSAGGNSSGNDGNGGSAVGSSGANAGGATNGGSNGGTPGSAGAVGSGGDDGNPGSAGNDGSGGDNGGAIALYGAVPIDPPQNDGGTVKPEDAGGFDKDAGAIQPLYGAVIVPS